MPTLRLSCPFCGEPTRMELAPAVGVREPTLAEGQQFREWVSGRFAGINEASFPNVLKSSYYTFHAPALCPECKDYSLVKGLIYFSAEPIQRGQDAGVDYSDRIKVLRLSPEPTITYPPEVPSEIAEVMIELEEDLRRRRNEARILSGCRSVLDVALQKLGETSGSRGDRIARLGAKGVLTSGLAEWAQKIWKDGHDGVHELQAKGHPVAEHVAFLKLFVEVAFVIPEKISASKIGP
jgi:hypothetical protein